MSERWRTESELLYFRQPWRAFSLRVVEARRGWMKVLLSQVRTHGPGAPIFSGQIYFALPAPGPPADTFDKVDPRDLNLGATVVAVTAYAFADSPTTLKHYTAAEVEDELKQIKSLDEYKDMQAHGLF